jgi:VWFA-related protein
MVRIVGAAMLLGVAPARVSLAGPQQVPPTFGTDTQVVLLDMVAKDGKGRPVADLRLEDVQVFEDGRRCQVQSFRLVRAAGGPAAATPTPPGVPQPGDQAPAAPSQANLVVLLFDKLTVALAPYARQGALDLLKQRFPPNTWFAVFKVYTEGTRMLRTFTADPQELSTAVQDATLGDDARSRASAAPDKQATAPPPSTPPAEAQRPPDLAPVPQDLATSISPAVAADLAELSQRVQTYDSLYALITISRSLAPVRGRKSVIYFGVDYEAPESTSVAYDAMVSAANRANVTIYTADVRGLRPARVGGRGAFDDAISQYGAAGPPSGGRGISAPATVDTERGDAGGGRIAQSPLALHQLSGRFLEHVAKDTGGLAIEDSNDLGARLAAVVQELGQYYEMAYTPPNPAQDGRFRRIGVKVLRPGVRVRTRSGYYATAASTPMLTTFELPLMAALAQTDPPLAFEHEAGLLQFAPRGGEREVVFLAQVPASAVGIARDPDAGTYRAHLALLALIKDATGRAVARLSQDWPVDGRLDPAGRPREAKFVFRRLLPLPPGRYTVEAALQDRQTGRLSTSRTAADVAAPAGSLALGSLTVVRTAEPADPAAGPDPLTVGGVAIQPELGTATLPPDTHEVPLLLPIYGAAGTTPELRVELRRGGESVKKLTPALPAPDAEGRRDWVGGITVGSLPAGRYEVVATVSTGKDTAESRTSFEIHRRGDPASAANQPVPATPVAKAPPVPAALEPVLERAGRYVLEYEQSFRDVAAEEEYREWVLVPEDGRIVKRVEGSARHLALTCAIKPWCLRSTKADVAFVRSSSGEGWSFFRDVYEVDDEKIRDREPRLARLFSGLPAAEAERQARGLLADSDNRYTVGPCMRNLNEPTIGLAILHPKNQPRFGWKQAGKRRVENVDTVEVVFEEVARPTLLNQSDGEPLPASGRLSIDPAHGTLVRSELEFRFAPRSARAFVSVEFRQDPALGMWVPVERREKYEDLPGERSLFGQPSKATAKFSGFHRLERAAEADVAGAAPSPIAPPAARGPDPAALYGPELVQALQRAGDYVVEYEQGFHYLVVEETYTQDLEITVQRTERPGPHGELSLDPSQHTDEDRRRHLTRVRVTEKDHKKQTTRADLVFMRLAGEFPWASYRDVFEVDGRPVRDHMERLVELFSKPRPDAHEQAKRLLAASAAYNIGPVNRTVNLPTLPLVFLLPDNQPRFEFRLGERKTIAATEVVELGFREMSRPTLVRGSGDSDRPAKGRFWVSPSRGTVVRSEVEFDFGPEAKARVTADYRPEPALAMWVPSEMREEYADVEGAKQRTFPDPFKGVARYGRFRRFTVTTQEGDAVAKP